MPTVELLKFIAGLLGVSVVAVLIAFALLIYSPARLLLSDILRAVGFLGRWARRASVATEMEAGINGFTRSFNKDIDAALLPECSVTWVTGENHAQTITPGSVVVRVSFGADHDSNFYNATATFVRHSLLPRAKAHLTSATAAAIDLILVRNILRYVKRSALRFFNERFNTETETTRTVYYKLESIDDGGLLNRVLIPEYHYYGETLGDRAPRPEGAAEADGLLNWLYQLVTKEQDELAPLYYSTATFRVGIILVAKEETYRTYGLEPYLRRASRYASEDFRTVYLLSRGRKRSEITKAIASKLSELGGFEQLLKQTEIRLGGPDSREIATCIPVRIDKVVLMQFAWDRVERAKHEGGDIIATVLAVDQTSVDVDIYGLRVSIENPYLSAMEIPDARRYFHRGQELHVRVVEVDQEADRIVVSNAKSETDPKTLVDAFAGKALDTLPATVVGYRTVDGLEVALRVAFENSPIEGYIQRWKACRSRFVPLSEKYPLQTRINVKVLEFSAEYNNWVCEVAGLQDPWAAVPDYQKGDVVDLIVREIAERYVVCELAEGVEGVVYQDEITWGGDEDRKLAIEALEPGQKHTAKVLSFDRLDHLLRLSFKRIVSSKVETFYESIKNQIVSAQVLEIRPSGCLVQLQETGYQGFLPKSEVTWGYCDSLDRVLVMGEPISVRAIAYREDLDSIVVSVKAARVNEYETGRSRLREGERVVGTIWGLSGDLAFVDVGYLFDSSSHYMLGVPGLVPGTADQAFVGRRFDSDSLLKQAIEQLAPGTGSATIEAESELVQVVRQMVRTDSTLVSPQQPALQERGDQVHPRQELGWEPAAPLQNCDLVLVSFRFQPRISFPAIGVDHTAGINRLLHKTVQAGSRGILDVA